MRWISYLAIVGAGFALFFPGKAFGSSLLGDLAAHHRESTELYQKAMGLLKRYQHDRAFRERLKSAPDSPETKAWLSEIDALMDKAASEMGKGDPLLQRSEEELLDLFFIFDTPAGERLQRMRVQFAETLSKFKPLSDRPEDGPLTQSEEQLSQLSQSYLEPRGPWFPHVVRAKILEGGNSLEPVVEL